MKPMPTQPPRITYVLLAAFLLLPLMYGREGTTQLLILASILMFSCCWVSAIYLLGERAALHFVLIAVTAGWLAEQLGSSYGWFFGSYTYTDVLGPTIGDVPVVIPLMWFALCYIAYVIGNLIVWQTASDGATPVAQAAAMSLLAAMIVTAFDLGADPYMVYKLKAWIMTKTDGWWFGETVEGFAGWVFVSFVIVFSFRLSLRGRPPHTTLATARGHALVPLIIYAGNMLFQIIDGYPVETRTVAVFAMGIPLLAALLGWTRWQHAPAIQAPRRAWEHA